MALAEAPLDTVAPRGDGLLIARNMSRVCYVCGWRWAVASGIEVCPKCGQDQTKAKGKGIA